MGLAISAAAFYIFTSIFAQELLRTSRWKVVTMAFVSAVLFMMGSGAVRESVLAWALLFPAVGLIAALSLKFWLRATWKQSLKIAGSYVGVILAFSVAISILIAKKGA